MDQPCCSLAPQNDFLTGTVSFATADAKSQAMELLAEAQEWNFDDRFDGLTVLKAAEEIDIE